MLVLFLNEELELKIHYALYNKVPLVTDILVHIL